ncbi:hypothetical protein ACH4SP_19705 [Streptomyces sp. NPDC021093]|uniref:hypothetical protein n=1 Tax=Streptomyces sp. NPDC021093 TaxID=3365112 RepID=UPI0037A9AA46
MLMPHAGEDGDCVAVHTWIEGSVSDLAVFTDRPETSPGSGRAELRIAARCGDVREGEVRR